MTLTPKTPPYERFSQLIESVELDVGASEVHGVLCGLLCAGHSDAHVAWFEELFANRSSDDLLVREVRQSLGQLYQVTQSQMNGDDHGFTPYLPNDKSPLTERASRLTEWCQGYLYGLGLAGLSEKQFVGNAKEAIGDIAEISRLDHEHIEAEEEAEAAFVELEEFLRVAALLVWEELASYRGAADD
ncbi:MAG: UPF0149 family protein [Pseudomonadota bacterium]